MKLLRTISTRRLLGVLAGVVTAIVAGTAIAIAAVGSGHVPPRKSLANAVHGALAAPAVDGVYANVTFTNRLIDSADIQGIDPLLTGGTGRLWVSPQHGLRLELQSTGGSTGGDAQLVVNGNSFWAYDPTSNTVYEGTLPADKQAGKSGKHHGIPTVAQIQSAIVQLMGHATVSTAIPANVGGVPAYTVRVSPKDGGGLIGGAELSWDANHDVPLRIAIYARGDSTPVLELALSNVSLGPQTGFEIKPPAGAKVVHVQVPATLGVRGNDTASGGKHNATGKKGAHPEITGVGPVSVKLSFPLDAPASLAGLNRSSVRLLGNGKHAGVLVSYGQGLGGIYVVERAASATKPAGSGSSSGEAPGLHLPSVTINGVQAQELSTALGTVLQFTRGGVSYTVLGSVTKATAEVAAHGL